jgi:hypothetical protein
MQVLSTTPLASHLVVAAFPCILHSQLASSADERASTHKNLGATMVQLAGLSSTSASTRQLLLQSVHHKCQAYVEGEVQCIIKCGCQHVRNVL